MLYGLLNSRNPDPEHDPAFLQELQDLYEGGYSILRRASAYLPKLLTEDRARYQERVLISSYISYLGQIVDSYCANLFGQELAVQPAADASDPTTPGSLPDVDYYTNFSSNADLKGTTFANVMRGAFSTALVKRCSYIAVDFPATGVSPNSLADEDKAGNARGYVFEVPPEQLVDWRYDDVVSKRVPIANAKGNVEFEVGKFAWVILKRTRDDRISPTDARGMLVDEFKIWKRDPKTNAVIWERYETAPYDPAKPPQPKDDVPLVDTDTTSFRAIPLVELRIPYGLWVGNKVAPLNKEHYRRRSALLEAMTLSIYEIPVAFLGSEAPKNDGSFPAERAQDPNRADDMMRDLRAQGIKVLGADDKFMYAGPSGVSFDLANKQLGELVDEMHRTAHQMAASVSSTASAVGRSGASKQEDRNVTTVILGAFGAVVRDFAQRIYGAISDARSEDVVWSALGLDKFESYDRADLLAEALQLDAISIPSRTWKVAMKTQAALKLVPNLPAETQQTIQREIDQGTTAEDMAPAAPPTGLDDTDPNADPNADPTAQPTSVQPTGALPANGAQPGKPGASTAAKAAPGASQAVAAPKPGDPPPDAPPYMRGTSSAGIAETVYNQLLEDYPKEKLGWVRATQWAGPQTVPLDHLDFSNQADWRASHQLDHVQDFVKQIKADGRTKPIILVNEPNNSKMIVIDGHHRALGYQTCGVDAYAYVGTVASVGGPWDDLHAWQSSGGMGSQQTSMQTSTQTSQQVSMQKSPMARPKPA